jgi:hypothetical protein
MHNFVLVKSKFQHISLCLISALILVLQSGFYFVHEHSLEILAEKCTHHGEHDFTFSEDCDSCDLFAHLTFESHSIPQAGNLTLISIDKTDYKSVEFKSYFSSIKSRGPPF